MSTAGATIVVTLDIGGSAAKASGYDVARQASLGSTATPYLARAADQDPGMFDPDSWWMAAVGALHDLRQLIDEPAGRFLETQRTGLGSSTGSISKFTTTASLSLRTSTHSSVSSLDALISWCGTYGGT